MCPRRQIAKLSQTLPDLRRHRADASRVHIKNIIKTCSTDRIVRIHISTLLRFPYLGIAPISFIKVASIFIC